MGVTFNPQVGATTQARISSGGKAAGVEAAAASGMALKNAMRRESKSQWEKTQATQREQFDTRMGMEQDRFDKTMKDKKRADKYGRKKEEKAERIARIGTSVTVGKLGLEMANEFDIDLAENLGFGEGDSIDAPGSSVPEQQEPTGFDSVGAEGDVGSPRGTGSPSGGDGGGSWWSQHGGQAIGAVAGGATGGVMGSQLSMALFGEGKTQSTAGGAVGGAAGGYAGSGSVYGGIGGAVVGGLLGYLMG